MITSRLNQEDLGTPYSAIGKPDGRTLGIEQEKPLLGDPDWLVEQTIDILILAASRR